MKTWNDIIKIFKGPTELGQVLGISKQTAHVMIQRGAIMPAYWSRLIVGAKARGHSDVTPELLGRLATEHPPGVAAE